MSQPEFPLKQMIRWLNCLYSDRPVQQERIKNQYEPNHRGKFLAIDIDSEEVFLANTSSEAVETAQKVHPNKVFYVVKIGFSAADILARLEKNI